MPVRIVWVSLPRAVLPLPSQVACIKSLLPHAELIVVEKRLRNATDVLMEFNRVKGNILVIIAPLSVTSTLVKKGVATLIPTMDRLQLGDHREEILQDGVPYKFNRFRWLRRVEIEYSEVDENSLLPYMTNK